MSDAQSHLPSPESRVIYFTKQVDQSSIAEVTKKIISINSSDAKLKKLYKLNGLKYKPQPIKIFIDSYGGYVYQCMGLLSIMNASKTEIHTIVTGCAMSCGFMILISGHKRFAYEHSTPLYHQVSSGAFGMLKDMEESIAETKRIQKKIEDITIEKTRITKKRLRKSFKGKEDWFMSAEVALQLGVVDEILHEIPN